MTSITVTAPDIRCEGCAGSIQRSLLRLPGVSSVSVGVDTKSVSVEFDETAVDETAVLQRLSDAGFPASPAQ
jgi:copper chaperone CopZ